MAIEKLEHEGEQYTRRSGRWVDSRLTVVCENLQKELNKVFAESLEPSLLTVEECIAEGDMFKASSSIGLALKYYEEAMNRADRNTLIYILPRITSCYRKNGLAQKVIDVLTYASNKYGKGVVTPALLTSAAAAYCDLRDYKRALKCCNRAYALLNGRSDGELSLVYKRIRNECPNI